jgi:Peptidase family M23
MALAACGVPAEIVSSQTARPSSAAPTATSTPCGPSECGSPITLVTPSFPTPSPVLSVTPQDVPACAYLDLAWPIVGPGVAIAATYRFGSTQEGQREPHHGVEMPAAAGTPVFAPAAGRVVYAGDDRNDHLGPYSGFYGNVVVIALSDPPARQPVFLLFAHLSQISVAEGQAVATGEQIGLVGSSGVAIGAHLHFEVRVGSNAYQSVRNPELYLEPPMVDGIRAGVLAGRVVDRQGQPASGKQVTVRRVDGAGEGQRVYFLDTYDLEKDTPGSDKRLGENFALSGLPPGEYEVAAFSPTLRQVRVRVFPGAFVWVPLGNGEAKPECTQ